jgi:hypothetical protein
MNQAFQFFYSDLCEPHLFDLSHMLEVLKPAGDFSDDLLTAMKEQIAAQNWGCLCKLVWIAGWFPSRKFTLLLREVLDNHRHDVLMEAVADALLIIKDERSVSSLINALDYYVDGDGGYHFNRKLVIALENIGTKEALNGVRLAAESPHEFIREDALEVLKRKQKDG